MSKATNASQVLKIEDKKMNQSCQSQRYQNKYRSSQGQYKFLNNYLVELQEKKIGKNAIQIENMLSPQCFIDAGTPHIEKYYFSLLNSPNKSLSPKSKEERENTNSTEGNERILSGFHNQGNHSKDDYELTRLLVEYLTSILQTNLELIEVEIKKLNEQKLQQKFSEIQKINQYAATSMSM